ncbi:electron transport complex subunit RsxE [bacterium Unc6]|nr:electron transport complex subunit RsxE [bacterium Unc6]
MAEKLCVKSCLWNGLCIENPVFRLMLGLCPALAVTTSVLSGFSMGLAAIFVLICSSVIISLLKGIIPEQIRIPCYIVVIATFVTITKMILMAYFFEIYNKLGLFIDIMVVNCIILGRVEAFASKNTVFYSFWDAVGMGTGFLFATTLIGGIREVLGSGTLLSGTSFVFSIPFLETSPVIAMILPPGAFLIVGFILGLLNLMQTRRL